jgi:hypothetical protein
MRPSERLAKCQAVRLRSSSASGMRSRMAVKVAGPIVLGNCPRDKTPPLAGQWITVVMCQTWHSATRDILTKGRAG